MSLLPWHQSLADGFRACLAEDRLPHAMLLAGPEGWGEIDLANWLALETLGLDVQRDAAALAHPDLRWLEPDGSVIKVDAVRELVGFAQGTPQAGPRKVAVLAQAHYLNPNAANALLKTLEEPPAGTHLLLCSAHPGRLLPTIRSRCQRFTIRPDAALARRWLQQRYADRDLDRAMFEHGGAPVAVMAALERGEQPLDGLLERWLQEGGSKAAVDTLLGAGLAEALGRWYRYVLAIAAGGWQPKRLGEVSGRALMGFADELLWVRQQLVTSNSANQRLLAERVLTRWQNLQTPARPAAGL